MYVDLITLYLLAVGTLLVSAGMTYWEHRSSPKRSRELRILAAGFATLALGCAAVLYRRDMPAPWGSAISNLIVLSGYLLILSGVAALSGRRYRLLPAVVLVGMALVWAIGGSRWQEVIWAYISSVPIAFLSGLTAWEMLRCHSLRSFTPRVIVVALAGIHTFTYAARALILPWLVAEHGVAMQALASKITIYEGVLYSVVLPMTLLKLIREETHGQLLRESQTDYLTRLGNRRWFFEEGSRLLQLARGRGPMAVLVFDLDHFKRTNDLYGHQTGDKVLRAFADIAQELAGPRVLLARIGGEEFAALLMGEDALRARLLADAIRRRFADTIPLHPDTQGVSTTVSIGLAPFDDAAPALADALAAADRALYRAKSLGGNRVETAQAAAQAAAA